MRKLLMLTVISILPAFGCADGIETIRRIEVWKAQTFFTPVQPVVMAPAGSNPCGTPAAAAPGCNCQQGAAVPSATAVPAVSSAPGTISAGTVTAGYPADSGEAMTAVPGTVTTEYPATSGETVSTEELDGVLKQP